MEYQFGGDLRHYIKKEFYNISWLNKLSHLSHINNGLRLIHEKDVIHRDFHSGNILVRTTRKNHPATLISDLGISKFASEVSDDNEIYGEELFLTLLQRFCKEKNTLKLQIFIVLVRLCGSL